MLALKFSEGEMTSYTETMPPQSPYGCIDYRWLSALSINRHRDGRFGAHLCFTKQIKEQANKLRNVTYSEHSFHGQNCLRFRFGMRRHISDTWRHLSAA
jgi:hypothetical protein